MGAREAGDASLRVKGRHGEDAIMSVTGTVF